MCIVTNRAITVDVVILGGGIAGLWILRSLRIKGYTALLLESKHLGGGQTMASQGVLHGGLKYALNGKLGDASEAVRDMPARWKACLEGAGEIDLTRVRVRSDHQVLWSEGKVASRITSFFATKALAGRIEKPSALPPALDHPAFKGAVYRLEEAVIDVPDLVRVLAEPVMDAIAHYTQLTFSGEGVVVDGVQVQAGRIVFAAGEGNAALMAAAGAPGFPKMQARPLHQVMVAHPELPPFHAVCMGAGTRPVLVTTTHENAAGSPVWYLGGRLAETGVTRNAADQVLHAQAELRRLMPWISLEGARWRTLEINRAEPATPEGEKPAGAYCRAFERFIVCWPTKLVMAPLLGEEVLRLMPPPTGARHGLDHDFPRPIMAEPAWGDL